MMYGCFPFARKGEDGRWTAEVHWNPSGHGPAGPSHEVLMDRAEELAGVLNAGGVPLDSGADWPRENATVCEKAMSRADARQAARAYLEGAAKALQNSPDYPQHWTLLVRRSAAFAAAGWNPNGVER